MLYLFYEIFILQWEKNEILVNEIHKDTASADYVVKKENKYTFKRFMLYIHYICMHIYFFYFNLYRNIIK